jgi:hypothetical protein
LPYHCGHKSEENQLLLAFALARICKKMLTLTMLPTVAIIAAANAAAPLVPKNVLWLPLGDSITWGCTGPTIQDCHGYPHGHNTGGVCSIT